MKLVIKGTAYPVGDAFVEPSVADSMRIVKETGLSLAEISARFLEMAQVGDNEAVASSPRLMEGFVAFVWLVRTAAGESLSLDQAADFKWSEWAFEFDPSELAAEAEPDPTPASPGSDPADAEPVPSRKRTETRSSKTSGKRSTRG